MTGNKLKEVRTKLGMSQTEFAELLGYKTYHSINLMESGKRKIPKTVEMVAVQIKKSK